MSDIDPLRTQLSADAPSTRHVVLVGQISDRVRFALVADPALSVRLFAIPAIEQDVARLVGADVVVWQGLCSCGKTAAEIVAMAERGLFELVVVLPSADPDGWGFALGRTRVAFVIDDDETVLMNEIGRALDPVKPIVSENVDAARRLAELGDEVARIAAALANGQASGRGGNDGGGAGGAAGAVSDRRLSYAADRAAPRVLTAGDVRAVIRARRVRDRFFPELFADPAWDILLDLLAARKEGVPVAVSSLCIAAGVPPTTALRWIGSMTEQGLLRREADPEDRRRVFIALSDEAAARTELCIRAILDSSG